RRGDAQALAAPLDADDITLAEEAYGGVGLAVLEDQGIPDRGARHEGLVGVEEHARRADVARLARAEAVQLHGDRDAIPPRAATLGGDTRRHDGWDCKRTGGGPTIHRGIDFSARLRKVSAHVTC